MQRKAIGCKWPLLVSTLQLHDVVGLHPGELPSSQPRAAGKNQARTASHYRPGNPPLSLEHHCHINVNIMAQAMIMSSALTCKPFLATPAARPSRNGERWATASIDLMRHCSRIIGQLWPIRRKQRHHSANSALGRDWAVDCIRAPLSRAAYLHCGSRQHWTNEPCTCCHVCGHT